MLKKGLTGGFLLLMVGAIVFGIISLVNQSEETHAWQGGRQDDPSAVARGGGNQLAIGEQGRGRRGQEGGANGETDSTTPGGGFGRGQGNNQTLRTEPQAEPRLEPWVESHADTAGWQTVEGIVVETAEDIVIETDDGETVQVGLGPSFYRDSQSFSLSVGDRVVVSGYLEDGEFKAGQIEKLDTGEGIVLRDSSGRPMWAGRGNRQNAVSPQSQTN